MNCIICQEQSNDDVVHTDCWHLFHISCIANWVIINDTCPLCRKENPCGIRTYYYTYYYYNVHGLIDGYFFDPTQYFDNNEHVDPGCYTVFRINDEGGDTDTLLLETEETIQRDNDEFQNEIDAYDQWEHENYHDY